MQRVEKRLALLRNTARHPSGETRGTWAASEDPGSCYDHGVEASALNAQSQGGQRRRRTYAVLIVHVVNLVDSQPLPLVQLLLLECKRQISEENLEGCSLTRTQADAVVLPS